MVKAKAPITRAKAKKNAWDAFSKFIRLRDCLRFKGSPTVGMCVTCKREYPFGKLQAGHFIPGRGNVVLFDERIVYSQCFGCNGNPPFGKGGNYIEYFVFMEQEWGREKIEEFRNLKFQTKVYKIPDLLAVEQEYKDRYDKLIEEHKNGRIDLHDGLSRGTAGGSDSVIGAKSPDLFERRKKGKHSTSDDVHIF